MVPLDSFLVLQCSSRFFWFLAKFLMVSWDPFRENFFGILISAPNTPNLQKKLREVCQTLLKSLSQSYWTQRSIDQRIKNDLPLCLHFNLHRTSKLEPVKQNLVCFKWTESVQLTDSIRLPHSGTTWPKSFYETWQLLVNSNCLLDRVHLGEDLNALLLIGLLIVYRFGRELSKIQNLDSKCPKKCQNSQTFQIPCRGGQSVALTRFQ